MQKRKSFLPTFLILFVLSLLLFILSRAGLLRGFTSFFEVATVPLQRAVFGTLHKTDIKTEIARLKEDNLNLSFQLVKKTETEREVQALRDQFAKTNPSPRTLLPALIIGGTMDKIIIDKGMADSLKKGNVVVVKDNLIGQIEKISEHQALVKLITHDSVSYTAKTLKTESVGVVRGQGGSLLIENVVLSERLEKDDLVVTKGQVDEKGSGFPPGLIVGKITSINKKASNIFQSAEVVSLVHFGNLERVFVIKTDN